MPDRSYVGIDKTANSEWIVVICSHGKSTFSRPFKNNGRELEALVRFITERCDRPKICLNPVNPDFFELVKLIGMIPGVELVLMTPAGFKLHMHWLSKTDVMPGPVFASNSRHAYLLACCAERMI